MTPSYSENDRTATQDCQCPACGRLHRHLGFARPSSHSNLVHIVAIGAVGSGKSALLGEIEIALKAIGIKVEWDNPLAERQEKNMTHADWAAELDRTKPAVLLREEIILP